MNYSKVSPYSAMFRRLPFLFFMVLFVLYQDTCFCQVAEQSGYVEGEALIIFKKDISRTDAESLHESMGSKILRHIKSINGDLVKIKEGMTVEEVIRAYQTEAIVEYAEPNWKRRIQTEK